MTLQEFAEKYVLHWPKADECGDMNMVGARGDIYVHDDKGFAATVLRCPSAAHWNRVLGLARGMGLVVTQNGDEEGTFLFDPGSVEEAGLAIRATRQGRRRVLSEAERENLLRHGAGHRFSARQTQSGGRVEGDLDSGEES